MPVKVYVWKPNSDDSYGHASMELSDGTYISWWPEYGGKAQRTKHKAPGFQNRTLEDDVRDEERDPDRIFIIPSKVGLNEDDIKRWWANVKSKEKWTIFNNCCDVVKRAIAAGGAEVTMSWIEMPEKIMEYIEDWQRRAWEPLEGKKGKKGKK